MVRITLELLRKRSEHNDGEISTLEELSLHQERLETIEVVDRVCKNLKILFLHNNAISKIENVSRLKQLEYLNLSLNNVEMIENLEGCESLTKLDLTLNFISSSFIRSIENLRVNSELTTLYLTGNPCADFEGYRDFVIATLPQLEMLDSLPVSKSERILAEQKYESLTKKIEGQQAEYSDERSRSSATGDEGYLDSESFWTTKTENTPEARLAMQRRLENDARALELKRNPPVKSEKKPSRRFHSDGRPLNMNEGKLPFSLHDEVHRNRLVLELGIPRYMDTSLVNLDVQPSYVTATVKGKVFQLVLPEEVKPDSSYACRSKTNGYLVVTMPKLHLDSKANCQGKGDDTVPIIDLTVKGSQQKSSKSHSDIATNQGAYVSPPTWSNVTPPRSPRRQQKQNAAAGVDVDGAAFSEEHQNDDDEEPPPLI